MQDIDRERLPFITGIRYSNEEYYGIVVNYDNTILTLYDLSKMPDQKTRQEFVNLGETWWWESNRMIPINIFLKDDMNQFKYVLMTMNSKDVKVGLGPTVNLNKLAIKRVKRKSVQLVKKPSR